MGQRYFLDTEENIEYTIDELREYFKESTEEIFEEKSFLNWLNAEIDYSSTMIEIYK